jgi:hypothetical protein
VGARVIKTSKGRVRKTGRARADNQYYWSPPHPGEGVVANE